MYGATINNQQFMMEKRKKKMVVFGTNFSSYYPETVLLFQGIITKGILL